MNLIKKILKFAFALVFILGYMAIAGLIWLVPFWDDWTKRRYCGRMLSRSTHFGLWVLNLKVNVHFEAPLTEPGYLMVGNHLSYIDILLISASRPTCFVTSVEIKETPFLGQACQVAGCLFVERRSRMNLIGEIKEISVALSKGFNVVIFPEATSTNGEQILRFKRPLFAAAITSGISVLPFCINYQAIDGVATSRQNRDLLCWYGDMDFASHLWGLVGLSRVDVDLTFLTPLKTYPDMESGDLAALAQSRVEAVFRPFP